MVSYLFTNWKFHCCDIYHSVKKTKYDHVNLTSVFDCLQDDETRHRDKTKSKDEDG